MSVVRLTTWDRAHRLRVYHPDHPNDGREGQLWADSPATADGADETFELVPDGDAFGLRIHGKYVSGQQDGTIQVNRDELHGWERWRWVTTLDGGHAIQSVDFGYHLRAEGGGGSTVNTTTRRDEWETFFETTDGSVITPGQPGDLSPLSPDGYWLKTAAGRYDRRERTDFSLLAWAQHGRLDHARALMREARGLGFNTGRVLCTYTIGADVIGHAGPDRPGYWEALDALCHAAYDEGYRLRLTIFGALEPFGAVWSHGRPLYFGDVQRRGDAFALELVDRVSHFPHVDLEEANEPANIGFAGLEDALVSLGRRIRQAWPGVLMNAGDVNGMDLAKMFDGAFNLVDSHFERTEALRFMSSVKRMGEVPVRDVQPRPLPVVSGEFVNFGEHRRDGRGGGQGAVPYPVTAFAYAAATRARQIIPGFHYDGGLYGTLMQPITVECAKAFHAALDAFPMLDGERWRGTQGYANHPLNYWDYRMNPGSDDPGVVERHVRSGQGPWRAFGIEKFCAVLPTPLGWDHQRRVKFGDVERVAAIADDAWGAGIFRRI